MRNSRHPAGPMLIYTRAEIAAFISGVLGGEFDDLARQRPGTGPTGGSPRGEDGHESIFTCD